jgi:hypothetical protein
MSFTVRVKGLDQTIKNLGAMGHKDVPFVTAATMTGIGKVAQIEIRTLLEQHFQLRHKGWMQRNVKITPAKKQSLQAEIVDTFSAMLLQETGGTKIPYGKFIAIPLVPGARRSASALIRPEDRPHAVMQAGGFIRDNIMYRVLKVYKQQRRRRGMIGPRNAERRRNAVRRMYLLVEHATIMPRYGFKEAVEQVARQQATSIFEELWRQYANK